MNRFIKVLNIKKYLKRRCYLNKQALKGKRSFWTSAGIVVAIIIFSSTVFSGCKTATETTAAANETVTTIAQETTTTAAATTTAPQETTTTAAATTTAADETTTTVPQETTTTAASEVKFTNETLVISGSTTSLEASQFWAEAFMKKSGGKITVNGGGSGVGISDLINGISNLANSSRAIKKAEKDQAASKGEDIKEYKVLIDGITVITSKNINVSELTLNQLADIYTGNITNWKDVGGPDATILMVGRDSSSGTGEFFLQKVVQLGQTNTNDYSPNMLKLSSNADVINQVEGNSNAIGYVGMGYYKEAASKVNLVKVKFSKDTPAIAPTTETVKNFNYPISRYIYVYANTKKFSAIAKAFMDFVLSPEGQALGEKAGFVKLQ
jgi:phosphate transport system substrate-binding protein